jgi:hypothetical protein
MLEFMPNMTEKKYRLWATMKNMYENLAVEWA